VLHVISASYKMSVSLTSGVAIAGVGIVRLSHYKALFGFPTFRGRTAENSVKSTSGRAKSPTGGGRFHGILRCAPPGTKCLMSTEGGTKAPG